MMVRPTKRSIVSKPWPKTSSCSFACYSFAFGLFPYLLDKRHRIRFKRVFWRETGLDAGTDTAKTGLRLAVFKLYWFLVFVLEQVMELVGCDLCQHKISPNAKSCPRCGHPRYERKDAKWHQFSFEVPKLVYALLFAGFCFGSVILLIFSMFGFEVAESYLEQVLAAQIGTTSAILALASLLSLIAADK